jgi:hypothetical protein
MLEHDHLTVYKSIVMWLRSKIVCLGPAEIWNGLGSGLFSLSSTILEVRFQAAIRSSGYL